MARDYKTPGVYIEEIPKFPPSIAAVETAIPAFVGYTEKAKLKTDDDLLLTPRRITSLLEYEQYFGLPKPEPHITVTIDDSQTPNEVRASIGTPSKYKVYYAIQAFYANGGGPCYIVSVGKYASGAVTDEIISYNPTGADVGLLDGLQKVEKVDEVTLLLFPDATGLAPADYYALQKDALDQCAALQDRFVIMDVYMHGDLAINDVTVFRGANFGTIDTTKYGAAYYPHLRTNYDYFFADTDVTVVDQNGDPFGGGTAAVTLDSLKSTKNGLYNRAKNEIGQIPMVLPSSSSVAGIYAQVDNARGVWKAPANIGVDNVIEPTVKISDLDQESLNVDPTAGKSINAIRAFVGRGPAIIWGARTLAGNDNEWRYVPVRRFFNMVEESTKKATEQFVFEPNDANTWTRVQSMIENFLTSQWRNGALQGATPEQAFYVSVGLGATMTALDILEGRMIVEIGMAVVRPAEFIILRFSHKMPEA